jgi:hypothetical protein
MELLILAFIAYCVYKVFFDDAPSQASRPDVSTPPPTYAPSVAHREPDWDEMEWDIPEGCVQCGRNCNGGCDSGY